MIIDLQPKFKTIHPLTFGDHHQFTHKDVERINNVFNTLPLPKMIITTEKDATRLEAIDGLNSGLEAACTSFRYRSNSYSTKKKISITK